MAQTILPDLASTCWQRHKGNLGRVCVVGGSAVYCGAPYFSGVASLKTGAELAHVLCHPSAAPSIKQFSPSLMVHPWGIEDDLSLLCQMDTVVVGPGLGRDQDTLKMVQQWVAHLAAQPSTKPRSLILDADYLWWLAQEQSDPQVFHQTQATVVLTPNAMELIRLLNRFGLPQIDHSAAQSQDLSAFQVLYNHSLLDQYGPATKLARILNTTLLLKGPIDIVVPVSQWPCLFVAAFPGCYKRPGGLGDILTGVLAVLLHWTHMAQANMSCAFALTSYITRSAQLKAQQHGAFSLDTMDVVLALRKVMASLENQQHKK